MADKKSRQKNKSESRGELWSGELSAFSVDNKTVGTTTTRGQIAREGGAAGDTGSEGRPLKRSTPGFLGFLRMVLQTNFYWFYYPRGNVGIPSLPFPSLPFPLPPSARSPCTALVMYCTALVTLRCPPRGVVPHVCPNMVSSSAGSIQAREGWGFPVELGIRLSTLRVREVCLKTDLLGELVCFLRYSSIPLREEKSDMAVCM